MSESVWGIAAIMLTAENVVLGEKPVPVPLYPLQVPYGLVCDFLTSFGVIRCKRSTLSVTEQF
jgi:hypothetical protein